ncbi:hypothetical protein E2C01_001511 [Portunus trituberculatus]|uniref:Uncharacterized protein n=1 Tax=Portunus trituberculatus TaxID=210409 RepID=A0A5B7CJK5_PORTR|nr:hypothetical protein [Portunus trituberculatus]
MTKDRVLYSFVLVITPVAYLLKEVELDIRGRFLSITDERQIAGMMDHDLQLPTQVLHTHFHLTLDMAWHTWQIWRE